MNSRRPVAGTTGRSRGKSSASPPRAGRQQPGQIGPVRRRPSEAVDVEGGLGVRARQELPARTARIGPPKPPHPATAEGSGPGLSNGVSARRAVRSGASARRTLDARFGPKHDTRLYGESPAKSHARFRGRPDRQWTVGRDPVELMTPLGRRLWAALSGAERLEPSPCALRCLTSRGGLGRGLLGWCLLGRSLARRAFLAGAFWPTPSSRARSWPMLWPPRWSSRAPSSAGVVAVSPRLRFAASTEARKRRHQIDDISGCGLGLGCLDYLTPFDLRLSMTCCSASGSQSL